MTVRKLPVELQSVAEKQLNEVPGRVQDDLNYIKEWLKKQPHLIVRQDDQWLLSFLRGCKFSLEKTKEKLDMFYTMRSILPEYFTKRDPFSPVVQEVLAQGMFLPLPKTVDPAAPRVVILRTALFNPETTNIQDVQKAVFMMWDVLLNEDDNLVVSGVHVLQDPKNATIAHMMQMTPTVAKKVATCIQHAYPIRPKGIHFINFPSFFETVFNMMKQFLTDKIKGRINIYSSLDDLYKVIPPSVLPKEYGGDGGTLEEIRVEWKKKVESYKDWFLEDAKYHSDESKRPGKPKTTSEVFGVEGSFRKLDVD